MTAPAPPDRGEYYLPDGAVTLFAPSLPTTPARRRTPPPASRPAARPRPSVPEPRPPSRLAELFADDEPLSRPADRPLAAQPSADPPPADSSPADSSPAVAVTVREAPASQSAPTQSAPTLTAEPIWVGVARGVAGALAAGALTGAARVIRSGGSLGEEIGANAGLGWLAHLAPLPAAAVGPALAFCGTALALFCLKTALPTPARWGAALAAAAVAGIAVKAAVTGGFATGESAAGFAPSLAWQIAVCGVVVLAGTLWNPGGSAVRGARLAPLIGLLACGLTFPLADGALGEASETKRSPIVAARAVVGWWGEAVRSASAEPHADGAKP